MRIDVHDVSVVFGDVTALESFSCDIRSHTVTALAGPSGSGKTTLLAALAGALAPTSGSIEFLDGDSVWEPRATWVSQSSNTLPDRSAVDNVAIAALARGMSHGAATAEAKHWLGGLGLAHRASAPARLLSGGEQQRLAFARALAADAELILADEPTANLDEENTRRLCDRLRGLARDRTIVVATHDPLVMAACDDVIRMRSDPVPRRQDRGR